jgi:hypothetical protein
MIITNEVAQGTMVQFCTCYNFANLLIQTNQNANFHSFSWFHKIMTIAHFLGLWGVFGWVIDYTNFIFYKMLAIVFSNWGNARSFFLHMLLLGF